MINFSNYIMLGKANRFPNRIKLRNTFKKIIKKKINLLLQFFYIFHRSSAKTLLK